MNICQLEYLREAIHLRSFTKTASKLYVTPQTISKAVRELERELGVNLFEKRGRDVLPTQLAYRLYPSINDALQGMTNLKTLAQACSSMLSETGALKLAISTSYYRGQFCPSKYIAGFEDTYSRIAVSKVFCTNDSCESALDEGIADAAIVIGSHNDISRLTSLKLGFIEPRIIISPDHPYATYSSLTLADLSNKSVARPIDLRTCYSAIINAIETRGIGFPIFTDLAPSLEAHIHFIQDGGFIFVTESSELASLQDKTIEKTMSLADRVLLPVHLMFDPMQDNHCVNTLVDYLRNAFVHNFA